MGEQHRGVVRQSGTGFGAGKQHEYGGLFGCGSGRALFRGADGIHESMHPDRCRLGVQAGVYSG